MLSSAMVGVCLLAALLLARLGYRKYHRHVGIGVVFDHYPNRKVILVSRLLESPAARAGLSKGDRLISYNGQSMEDLFYSEFNRAFEAVAPKKAGDIVRCVIARGETQLGFEMRAETIQGPIPIHPFPSAVSDDERPYIKEGLAVCRRTGEWIQTRRLSDYALDKIFNR